MSPPSFLSPRFVATATLLAESLDIIDGQVNTALPGWAAQRGWSDYLLGLPEDRVARAETTGIPGIFLEDVACPPTLAALAARVHEVISWWSDDAGTAAAAPHLRRASPRKSAQVAAVVAALDGGFAGVDRVVDIGAGHGHLTTRIAGTLGLPSVGLERDARRVAVARTLAGPAAVDFEAVDLLGGASVATLAERLTSPGRVLALTLHGCGELGDLLVQAAAQARADVLLVGCCPQKIRATHRTPLCLPEREADRTCAPRLSREVLGLANLLPREDGIERPLREELAVRETRLALRLLLADRGLTLAPGEEMRGLNRRRAHRGLAALAAPALARRALGPATDRDLAAARERARTLYPDLRRAALPRTMLGRVIEVHLCLDRALYLERAGYASRIVALFPVAVSPRNLAVLAQTRR